MISDWKKWLIGLALAALAAAAGVTGWFYAHRDPLGKHFASGNGRVEATELDVSAKAPGRIREMLVDEGDEVKAGQTLATIDTDSLAAQREQAQAQVQQTLTAVTTARMQVAQAMSQRAAAVAQLRQREADLASARRHLDRSATLAREGATPQQEQDDDRARVEGAKAMVEAARAQLAAADAGVATARSQLVGAGAIVDAARATTRRLDADIADTVLRAPRSGRVQYRVAQPGEVVGAGGRVLDMVDLDDVTMTFFLPEQAVGRILLGSEARIVLDTAPTRPVPARISFVSDVAQFTPKTVETQDERQKLMFRVKARIDPKVLVRYRSAVKSGVPGVAYVRLDSATPWPSTLSLAR